LNQLMVFLNCSKERTKFNADATIGYMVRENGNEFAKFEKECLTTTQLEQLNLNLINILTRSAQELVQNAAEKAYNAGYSYGINNPVNARAQSQPTPSIHCNISPSLGFKGQTDVNCY
ncbi:MAG TPA: hypothetical protein VMW36_09425, partial [Patescibacteria group bacterium]|nr:hypothetical protein [Patescibacteria group bacterium]